MRRVVCLIVLFAFSLTYAAADEPEVRHTFQWQPYSDPSTCQEENSWWTTPQGIRVFLNRTRRDASGTETTDSNQKAAPKTHLVIFATPNGNSLEETSGSAPLPELSFRFGIQHILAQTRLLRTLDPNTSLVLAIVQAPKLSWPAFRGADPKAGVVIPELVQTLSEAVNADEITLSGHSGGGAFLLEYITRTSSIPTTVRRFLFLDATYSWDDMLHRAKVDEWLRQDSELRLVSIAYDDREITLNGRKVVGPDGGTWRATERMRNGFAQTRMLKDDVTGPFLRTQDEGRQIVLLRHPNPDNKILHTALVGDMNGLIAGMTFGTPQENSWGKLGDGPVYQPYIPGAPLRAPSRWNAELVVDAPKLELSLPPRLESMRGGRELAGELERLVGRDREDCIASELLSGNMPQASRELALIRYRATDTAGTDHDV
ncbi:MAG: hypothetical protein JNM43_19955 [Planctomycetaceae bacterium]|nr:hypothetical protein [Planctomycetaceae bacterium]